NPPFYHAFDLLVQEMGRTLNEKRGRRLRAERVMPQPQGAGVTIKLANVLFFVNHQGHVNPRITSGIRTYTSRPASSSRPPEPFRHPTYSRSIHCRILRAPIASP